MRILCFSRLRFLQGLSKLKTYDNLRKPIVSMIGIFHLAKNVKHCLRKLLRRTGYQKDLVKTKVFGSKTVEAVMSHVKSYYRENHFVWC